MLADQLVLAYIKFDSFERRLDSDITICAIRTVNTTLCLRRDVSNCYSR